MQLGYLLMVDALVYALIAFAAGAMAALFLRTLKTGGDEELTVSGPNGEHFTRWGAMVFAAVAVVSALLFFVHLGALHSVVGGR